MATKWDIELNVNKLNQQMAQVQKQIGAMSDKAKEAGFSMKEMFKQTAMFAGVGMGAAGIKEFGNQVIQVRKKMQSLQVSFETLLGSQQKAVAMFGELKKYAATTPLMLDSLASGAQTMLAFNIEAEKVVPTLKAIGDISMGDSQKFQSLTLAFSQMSATGKLMGQDLLQMINAGFNPLTEISRKTGKSISELKDEMSAGAISADMVAQAFMDATSEGGKFFGMLEKQGQTLAGQLNQLQGAIDDMFNSIGEQTEGVISTTVSGMQLIIENYDKVGKILATLIATYGTYKAALMAVNAVDTARILGLKEAAQYMMLDVKATKAATLAQKAFNAVSNANPYVLLATTLMAVVGAMWAFSDAIGAAESAQDKLNKSRQRWNDQLKAEGEESERLLRIIQENESSAEEKRAAYEMLKKSSHDLTQQYSLEELQTMKLADAMSKVNESNKSRSDAEVTKTLKERKKALKYLLALRDDLDNYNKKDYKLKAGVRTAEVNKYIGDRPMDKKAVDEEIRRQRKLIADEEKILGTKEKTSAKNDDHNKEYWEAQKKEKQAELDKLTDIEAMSEKGLALKKQIIDIDKKIKAYDASSAEKNTAELKKQKEAEARAIKEQSLKVQRANEDAGLMEQEAYIKSLENGREKTLAQLRYNYDKESIEIEREKNDRIKEAEDAARAIWEANDSNKGKTWDDSLLNDNEAYQDAVDSAILVANAKKKVATKTYQDGIKEQANAEADAMRKYLIDYGTYQQKRLALEQSYQKQIADADNEGDKLRLKEEMKKAIGDLDMDQLKTKVNWGVLFGDLNLYTKDQLKAVQKQVKEYKKSDEYKNATVENKKVVDEAYASLESTILSKGGVFGGLADAFSQLAEAQIELDQAIEDVKKTEKGTKEREDAIKRQNKAQSDVDKAQGNVRSAVNNTSSSISSLASTITQLGTASELSLADLGSLANTIASSFGEAGEKAGGWIEAIFVLCDMIAQDGIEGLVENIGDLLGKVLGGLFDIDVKESERYYNEQKKLNDVYLELIDETVSKAEELMKKQAGLNAYDTYKEVEQNLEAKKIISSKNIKNYLNAGASDGFLGIGSSRSNGRKLASTFFMGTNGRVNEDYYDNYLRGKRLQEILGVDSFGGRMEVLADATVEQIKLIKEDADIWANLPEEVRDYYQEILDANDELEKMKNTLNETILGTSFDSLESSFASSIENMDATASDFADDMESMFNKAIVNSLVNEKYSGMLKQWYQDLSDMAQEADGIQNLNDEQIGQMKERYMNLTESAKRETDMIREKFGIDSTNGQAATTINSAMSVTEDTANELIGRITTMQILGQKRNDTIDMISATMTTALAVASEGGMNLSNLVDLAAIRNSYLNDIYTRLGQMYVSVNERLDSIATNTSRI